MAAKCFTCAECGIEFVNLSSPNERTFNHNGKRICSHCSYEIRRRGPPKEVEEPPANIVAISEQLLLAELFAGAKLVAKLAKCDGKADEELKREIELNSFRVAQFKRGFCVALGTHTTKDSAYHRCLLCDVHVSHPDEPEIP